MPVQTYTVASLTTVRLAPYRRCPKRARTLVGGPRRRGGSMSPCHAPLNSSSSGLPHAPLRRELRLLQSRVSTRTEHASLAVSPDASRGRRYPGCELYQRAPFPDVHALEPTPDFNLRFYVEAGLENGIIQGVSPRLFAPYSPLTRAQVVTIVMRAAKAFKPEAFDSVVGPAHPRSVRAPLGQPG